LTSDPFVWYHAKHRDKALNWRVEENPSNAIGYMAAGHTDWDMARTGAVSVSEGIRHDDKQLQQHGQSAYGKMVWRVSAATQMIIMLAINDYIFHALMGEDAPTYSINKQVVDNFSWNVLINLNLHKPLRICLQSQKLLPPGKYTHPSCSTNT
jgi:hypothetical protein